MFSKKSLLVPMILLFSVLLHGQGVDERAKNKAENKVNNRVDTRIDQGLDKGLDALEGLFKKKKKKKKGEEATATGMGASESAEEQVSDEDEGEGDAKVVEEERPSGTKRSEPDARTQEVMNMYSQMMGGMFQPAEWEDSYSFPLVSEATITSTEKSGKQRVDHMHWFASKDAFGMKITEQEGMESDGFVVFDFKNNSFITLNERKGKKEGMAMAMNEEQQSIMNQEYQEKVDEEYEDVVFTKTGKSKMIAGHLAWEYLGKSENGSGTMWVCEDIDFDSEQYFGLFGNSSGRKDFMPDNYPEGYLLEMDYTDAETGESYHYIVTRIDDDADEEIDLRPYDVKDMQQMMQQGGKR